MYPVGVLFGLGFDTATEVGLLGIVATSGSTHLPVFYIMAFPLMFLAGMTVIDTTDSIMMLGAYGWAFVKPIRKLYYNLNITLISVLVALIIGLVEALQVFGQELNLGGPFWNFIANDIDLNKMGFFIVGIFALAWDHLHARSTGLTTTTTWRSYRPDRPGRHPAKEEVCRRAPCEWIQLPSKRCRVWSPLPREGVVRCRARRRWGSKTRTRKRA